MTNTLTAAEIASMRADLQDVALPDTCIILTGTATSDGQGGMSIAWGTTTTGVKCRVDHLTGMEAVFGGALKPFAGYNLTVAYNTVLTAANRVEHGGVTYSVIEVDPDKSWALFLRARLERT